MDEEWVVCVLSGWRGARLTGPPSACPSAIASKARLGALTHVSWGHGGSPLLGCPAAIILTSRSSPPVSPLEPKADAGQAEATQRHQSLSEGCGGGGPFSFSLPCACPALPSQDDDPRALRTLQAASKDKVTTVPLSFTTVVPPKARPLFEAFVQSCSLAHTLGFELIHDYCVEVRVSEGGGLLALGAEGAGLMRRNMRLD